MKATDTKNTTVPLNHVDQINSELNFQNSEKKSSRSNLSVKRSIISLKSNSVKPKRSIRRTKSVVPPVAMINLNEG